jgi:short-subunit dehydrogenase
MKILITGSSEGIGLEVAKTLANENKKITLVSRSKEKLEKARASLHGSGHQIIVADLSTTEDIEMLKEIIETNKYDVLINNAGVGMYGRFTDMLLPEQTKMMNLNINALTTLSYYYLRQAKSGDALVNISSMVGITGYPGASVYAGTKGYVTKLSESLWWENKNKGIYVLGFCPGATYTNFHDVAGTDKNSFSKSIMQTPEQVSLELVNALKKRKKPIIVSGGTNRFLLFVLKMMSRKMVVNMMGKFGPLKGE